MNYRYGWAWNNALRQPVDELTEEQARRAWEKAPQVSVSALAAGTVPEYTIEATTRGEHVRVNRYTGEGSVEVILDYATENGRLFLMDVTEYLYEDDGEYHHQGECKAVREYFFRPDGTGDLTTDIAAAERETVEQFSDVDVSTHWIDPLVWGDWDRVGLYQA